MTGESEKTYPPKPGHVRILRLCLWFFLVLGLSFPALLLLTTGEWPPESDGAVIVVAGGAALFLGFALLAVVSLRRVPLSAMTIDAEGIWPAHEQREAALVPWGAIRDVRGHSLRQFLELRDAAGQRLLRVEYLLEDFAELRERIIERVEPPLAADAPARFSRKPLYHVVYPLLIAGLAALGWYLFSLNIWAGGGSLALAGLAALGYAIRPTGVSLDDAGLTLHAPLSARTLPYEEIEEVRLVDVYSQGNQDSLVHLAVRGRRRPLVLSGFDVDNTILYKAIRRRVN